jgi:hypothetical protein
MNMRIVIFAVYAVSLALAQTALIQPAYAGIGWPASAARIGSAGRALPTTMIQFNSGRCRGADGSWSGMIEWYVDGYGHRRRKCVSRDYYRVEKRAPDYRHSLQGGSTYEPMRRGGQRGQWDDRRSPSGRGW